MFTVESVINQVGNDPFVIALLMRSVIIEILPFFDSY
jgi:hypothetical protein